MNCFPNLFWVKVKGDECSESNERISNAKALTILM